MKVEELKSKVFIFLGPFGTGKTELSMNFSMVRKRMGGEVALADIDIISPYFRIRDFVGILEEEGIKVILPPLHLLHADLPIITATVGGYIENEKYEVILDVGGEDDGVAVLGYLKRFLDEVDYTSFMVINAKRPLYRDPESIVEMVERLSRKGRVRIDFLVNSTNLGGQTEIEDIREGEKILSIVSERMKIPVGFSVVPDFVKDVKGLKYDVFRIRRFLGRIGGWAYENHS